MFFDKGLQDQKKTDHTKMPKTSSQYTATQSSQDDRQVKRRRASRSSIVKVPHGSGLPKILRGTYRYAWTGTATTDINGIGAVVYYANGMTQPEAGAATHQPHYFEEIMKLYDHYRVIKSKITVKPRIVPSTNVHRVSLFIDDDTTPSLINYDDAAEREGAVSALVQPGNQNQTKLTKTFNSKEFFGPKAVTDSFYGTHSTNPTENATFVVAVVGDVSAVYKYDILIEYSAEFSELSTVPQSA